MACTGTVLPATDRTVDLFFFFFKNEINKVGCEGVLYGSMDWAYFAEIIAHWRAIVRAVKRV